MHLSKFRSSCGSDVGLLVFDVNDFDETTPGPWEWDVKRLTSMEVAARGNGFGRKERREIVTATVTSYRQAMRDFANNYRPGRLGGTRTRTWTRSGAVQLADESAATQGSRQGHDQGAVPGQHAGTGRADRTLVDGLAA